MQNIFVTGAPRSGTTAVGSILSLSRRTDYVYEPFSFHGGLKDINGYFEFPNHGIDELILNNRLDNLFELNGNFKNSIYPHDSSLKFWFKKIVGGRNRLSFLRCKYNPFLENVIWKDPLAVFCTPWLSSRNIKTVITRRSIFSIAASFKRLNWSFDVVSINRALKQSNRWSFSRSFLDGTSYNDHAINGALLWALVYCNIDFRDKNIKLINVGELLDRPAEIYSQLFEWLGLEYTGTVERKINDIYKSSSGPSAPKGKHAHSKKRNLNDVETYGLSLLSDAQIEQIKAINEYMNFNKVC